MQFINHSGRALFLLSSIAQCASAAAISNSPPYSNFTLPFSTATTYDAKPLSAILPSGAGIVVNSSKTISFVGTTTEAVYALPDGCVTSAFKQGSSVISVPGKACSNSTPITSSTASSSSITLSLGTSNSHRASNSTLFSSLNGITLLSTSGNLLSTSPTTFPSPSTNLPLSNSLRGNSTTFPSSSTASFSSTASISSLSRSSSTSTGSSSGPPFSSVSHSSSSAGTGNPSRFSSSSASSSTGAVSSNSNSALPGVTLNIVTSIIIESGTTFREPIITGGGLSAPITLPPVTTTLTGIQATSAVSSVSSQIVVLIPIINSWKANPTPLKTNTLNKVKDIKSDVESLISDLGSDASSEPCGSKKKKRGLLSPISDIIHALSCIDEDLENITDKIDADDVEDVESSLVDLKFENENLDDEEDNNSNSNTDSHSSTDISTSTSPSTSTSTETRSSYSSCTSTETAFRVTVLCLPTTFTTSGSTISTTTCLPTTTVTTSGCSVTGTTTTVTSSGSTSATQTPCASDTCGGACPLSAGPLSGASMAIIATTEDCSLISTSTTSALPTASYGIAGSIAVATPTGSTSATSKREFSSDLLDYNETLVHSSSSLLERTLPDIASSEYADYVSTLSQGSAWVSQQGLASGHWYDYPLYGQAAVGVNGIYGCTAVIISSEKGVYLSHIWENPVFIDNNYVPTDNTSFTTNTFNALRDGTADALSITSLIGTDTQPGVLNAIYAPKVFVLTPLTTDFDRDNYQITTRLRYQARAEDLASKLAGILPGSGGTGFVLGYTRTSAQASTQNPGTAGRAILEVDPFQSWLTTTASDADPTAPGLQIGRWRLWVEDQLITYQDFWLPYTVPTSAIQQRELGYTNPCISFTNNSTSSSSTSSVTSSSESKTSSSSNSLTARSSRSSSFSTVTSEGSSTLEITTTSRYSISSIKSKTSSTSNSATAGNSPSSTSPKSTQISNTSLSAAPTTLTISITSTSTPQPSIVPLGEGETYCTSDSDCKWYDPCVGGANSTCILSANTCGCPAT